MAAKDIKHFGLILVAIVALVAVVGLVLFIRSQTAITPQESCEAAGDRWTKAGLSQSFMCIHDYSDGGKSCQSSEECEGDCIAENDGTAYCDDSNSPFGCYRTIEDYNADVPVRCVD